MGTAGLAILAAALVAWTNFEGYLGRIRGDVVDFGARLAENFSHELTIRDTTVRGM